MEQVLTHFITALRNAGIRVSVSESIDAANTLDIVGYNDKTRLKTSLAAALAKTLHEKEIFDTCFDLFFSFHDFSEEHTSPDLDFDMEAMEGLSPLSMMILSGDQASLATSMIQAGQALELSNMQYFTQRNPFVRRILDYMGLEELDNDMSRLSQNGSALSQQQSQALRDGRGLLIEYVRTYVDRNYELYTRATQTNLLERHLMNMKLSHIEDRNVHQMHIIIKKMVKRLKDLHSRRKRNFRRGQLDFKKTLRKNITYGGPLFEIMWKKRKIDRPSVVVICDVSRSVRMVVRFFLLFLYSLNELIVKIRSFIFCNNLIEVSSVFDDHPVEEAVEILQKGIGLDIGLSRTNYGQAFRDFQENWINSITNKTTVIILGDARNNFYEPEIDLLRNIHDKAKRLIWLNPEGPTFWGVGDSEMKRYGPLCDLIRECNTLNHLERIVDDIL
jgi:uncharacterized protein with von Willebrand factor type A (vWA) domain